MCSNLYKQCAMTISICFHLTVFILYLVTWFLVFPGDAMVKYACQCRRHRRLLGWDEPLAYVCVCDHLCSTLCDPMDCSLLGFWGRKWQPIPIWLPGKFHGQRSPLAGYSPGIYKESEHDRVTEHTHDLLLRCIHIDTAYQLVMLLAENSIKSNQELLPWKLSW